MPCLNNGEITVSNSLHEFETVMYTYLQKTNSELRADLSLEVWRTIVVLGFVSIL